MLFTDGAWALCQVGSLLKRKGGFHEVLLPMLEAGKTHNITLYYAYPEMTKPNRAWLPTGSYLRIQKSCFALPSGDFGVRINTPSEFKPFVGLPLIPQPFKISESLGC
jgi:hypothetical protein